MARRRSGHVLIVAALAFPAILAVMGLALDGGRFYQLKRRMQAAADAGAMGGGHELWRGNASGITDAARMDTALNGFTNGVNNTTVTVTNGVRGANISYVEVIVSRTLPTTFMRLAGIQSSVIRSRAVAELRRDADFCVLALDPNAALALTVGGTASLTAPCGVMVNSTNPVAFFVEGGAPL